MKNLYTLLTEKMNKYDEERKSSTKPEGLHHPSVSPEQRAKRIRGAEEMRMIGRKNDVDFLKSVRRHKGKKGVKSAIKASLSKVSSRT
jgi:hypothetical protein